MFFNGIPLFAIRGQEEGAGNSPRSAHDVRKILRTRIASKNKNISLWRPICRGRRSHKMGVRFSTHAIKKKENIPLSESRRELKHFPRAINAPCRRSLFDSVKLGAVSTHTRSRPKGISIRLNRARKFTKRPGVREIQNLTIL